MCQVRTPAGGAGWSSHGSAETPRESTLPAGLRPISSGSPAKLRPIQGNPIILSPLRARGLPIPWNGAWKRAGRGGRAELVRRTQAGQGDYESA